MSSAGITNTTTSAPTVLAVGCTEQIVQRCAKALTKIGAVVKECSIAGAVNVAVERKPLVILMLEDVFAFDPNEFTALARDLRSTLVRVEPDVDEESLEGLLAVAISRALSHRDERTSTGRYAIIGTPAPEAEAPPPYRWPRSGTRPKGSTEVEVGDDSPPTRREGAVSARSRR